MSEELVLGSTLGPFRILRPIGKGGMGAVYLAFQTSLKRQMAVKVISSPSVRKEVSHHRFLREIELCSQLDHPNIVKIYCTGSVGKLPYFAMDYVEGLPLHAYVKEKKIAMEDKLLIVKTIAEALGYAHQKGIIHRDVKPSNIMIESGGRPVLMDFGLAKNNKIMDKKLTVSGEILGTPRYMSPEQARGEKDIDGRSDLYALGCVLYEIATEAPMFEGESTIKVLYQVFSVFPRLPRDIDPSIPPDVEALILKSTDKNKKRRYQTAGEFVQDIERCLDKKSTQARRGYRLRKIVHRAGSYQKLSLYATASLILFFSVGIVATLATLFLGRVPGNDKLPPSDWKAVDFQDELKRNPSREKYDGHLDFLEKSGYDALYLKQCDAAIEWARAKMETGEASHFSRKKAAFLYKVGQYASSYEIYRSLADEGERVVLPLARAAFPLKKYREIIQALGRPEEPLPSCPPEEKVWYSFLLGASFLGRFLEDVPRREYLDRVSERLFSNEQQERLEKAIRILSEALQTEKGPENLKNRILLYLGYACVWKGDCEKAQKILQDAIQNNAIFPANEELLVREALGMTMFCRKDPKAVDYFTQCIEVCPWDHVYYLYRAHLYSRQEKRSLDALLDDCAKSFELSPSDLSPLNILCHDMINNQDFEEIFNTIYLGLACLEKTNKYAEPELWQAEYKSLAGHYMQYLYTLSATKGISQEGAELLVRKGIAPACPSATFEMVKEVLSNAGNYGYLLARLQKERNRATHPASIAQIDKLVEAIMSRQKEGTLQVLKTLMARFLVGRDISVRGSLAEHLGLIGQIVHDPKESPLLRYWAAKILLDLQMPEACRFLEAGTKSANSIGRLLCLSMLEQSGSLKKPDFSSVDREELQKIDPHTLTIVLHHIGEYFPKEVVSYFLGHRDSKVGVCAAKSMLRQGDERGIEKMVVFMEDPREEVRAFAHWWFYDPFMPNFQEMEPRLLQKLYLDRLEYAVTHDVSSLVRKIAAFVIERIAKSPKEETIQKRLEQLGDNLSQALEKEKDETARLQMLTALMNLKCFEAVLDRILDPKESFHNRIAPLFKIFMDKLDTQMAKEPSEIQSTIAKFIMSENPARDPNPHFRFFYLFCVAMLGQSGEIPAFVKNNLVYPQVKRALVSSDAHDNFAAVYATCFLYDEEGSLRKALKKKFSQAPERNKQYIVSSLSYHGLKDLRKGVKESRERKYHEWLRKQMKQYPASVAYGHYRFFEIRRLYNVDIRRFDGLNLWARDQVDFLCYEAIVHKLFKEYAIDIEWKPLKHFVNSYLCVEEMRERSLEKAPSLIPLIEKVRALYHPLSAQEIDSSSPALKQKIESWKDEELQSLKRFHIARILLTLSEHLEKSTEYNPSNPGYHFIYAFLLECMGELQPALASLSRAIELAPTHLYYRVSRARVLFKLGRVEKAQQELDELASKKMSAYDLFELQAKVHLSRREYQKARDFFHHQTLIHPHLPAPFIGIGLCDFLMGDEKKAREGLEYGLRLIEREKERVSIMALKYKSLQFVNLAPSRKALGDYHFTMALIAASHGKKEEMLAHCESGKNAYNEAGCFFEGSPFTLENFRRYRLFLPFLEEPAIKNFPSKIVGLVETR